MNAKRRTFFKCNFTMRVPAAGRPTTTRKGSQFLHPAAAAAPASIAGAVIATVAASGAIGGALTAVAVITTIEVPLLYFILPCHTVLGARHSAPTYLSIKQNVHSPALNLWCSTSLAQNVIFSASWN